MKKIKYLSLFLVIIMALGLVGCASGDGGESAVSETASSDAPVSDAESNGASDEASNESEASSQLESEAASEEASKEETEKDPTVIRVGGMKGPTSMGMVKLMKDNEDGVSLNNYNFTIEAGADSLNALIVKGELDIAALPSNVASALYNKTEGKVKLLAVNTLGVIYIVNRGEAITLADLKGKTIYATGKGAVPEYALRFILLGNGIDPEKDVNFEWKSQPEEVVAALSANEDAIAMLPQPFVTVACNTVEGLGISINLTEEWDKLNLDSRLITGTLVVRAAFAEEHPELVKKFLEEYRASTEFVNANVEEAAALVEKYGIVKAAVAKKAIPYCNIVFIAGNDMKAPVLGYLKTVFDTNATAVGGKMPDDGFFYVAE